MQSTDDHTRRVRAFLALSRQIQQVVTDYDILDATLEHLRKDHQWFEANTIQTTVDPQAEHITRPSVQDNINFRAPLHEIFDAYVREAKLVRTYSKLYDERAKIGVSEGFAMINQRDAEVCE